MPSAKCGGCARFISPLEAAKCKQCNGHYHRACVALPTTGHITPNWCCPECSKNVIRDNKADTPVRGKDNFVKVVRGSDEPLDTSTIDVTGLSCNMDPSANLVDELRLFKDELRAELRLVRHEFKEFRSEISRLKESLKINDERMNNLEGKVDALEQKLEQNMQIDSNMVLQNTIAELKTQLNERDQELLLNDVEIVGIPESRDESIFHYIKLLSVKSGITLDERDVVHVERVGSTRRNRVDDTSTALSADPAAQRPRAISVRFARRSTRDSFLRAARVRRGFGTDDLEMGGHAQRVYVNERLTRSNRHIFYRARQAGSQYKWRYVWTRDGKIFARKEEGLKSERIRSEDDIVRIFGLL